MRRIMAEADDEENMEVEVGIDVEHGWVFVNFTERVRSVCFRPASAIKIAESILACAKRLQN